MTPDERIAQLEAEIQRLREQNVALLSRVQDLEARLAKDSHNSGKPPSSDGLRRKTKSLRQKSGKKPGGQLGHRGETLHLVATPGEVVEHRPAVCGQCQTPLADGEVVLYERRQVQELPAVVRLVVSEHRALHVRCLACGHLSVGAFPAEAPSRAQYGSRVRALAVYLVEQQHLPLGRVQQLLADLLGMRLARGTLVGWVQQAVRVLEPVQAHIKAALCQAPVLHHDETGVRRGGKLAWAHVTCTSRLTHYGIHTKRGQEAMDAIGILPSYRGVSVHDGWDPYGVYTACRHALCNVHHLRDLTFLKEEYHQAWAADLKALLREMKAATDQARARGQLHLAPEVYADFLQRYQAFVEAGRAANPPPRIRSADPDNAAASNRRPRATCSNGSCCSATRCSPSWATSRSPSITTKQNGTCAISRSNKRSRAASVATGGRTPTRRSAGIWRPCASRATRSWPPSTPSSPVSLSIQPLPDLLQKEKTR
jgi:transposase